MGFFRVRARCDAQRDAAAGFRFGIEIINAAMRSSVSFSFFLSLFFFSFFLFLLSLFFFSSLISPHFVVGLSFPAKILLFFCCGGGRGGVGGAGA